MRIFFTLYGISWQYVFEYDICLLPVSLEMEIRTTEWRRVHWRKQAEEDFVLATHASKRELPLTTARVVLM